MQDSDIRKVLHSYLKKENKPIKDTIIVDELDLCSGLARIDVAVINGVIHGYEIKSEEDTLKRLPNQLKYYNKSLEEITIVLNPIHFEKVIHLIPEWWGIITVDGKNNKNTFAHFRKASPNPLVEGRSLLQILWKEELLLIAGKYEIKLRKSFNKRIIHEVITENLDVTIISQEVRALLKSRKNWRN